MIELAFPFGLWLALSAAGVLAAHLVRRRARRREVPFLPLWTAVVAHRRGGFGARVVRHLDLLLVLLACAAVAAAAAGPFVPGTSDRVRDLVLVLDGGVSLRAGARHDRLRKVADAEVRRRAPGTRFVVIAVGDDGPAVWAGTDKAQALRAVRAHAPGWLEPGRDEALALAAAARDGLRDADVVLCTHRPGRPEGVRLRTVAEEVRNAGVAALEVLADPEGGGSLARLVVRGRGEVEVPGRWRGEVEGMRTVDVALPGAGPAVLTVRAEGDGFPADDRAFLFLPELPAPRLLVVAEGEPSPFLAAALAALQATGVVLGPLERTVPEHAAEAATGHELLVFDRCAPPEPVAGVPAIYLAPPGGALPFRVGDEADAPALFDVRREHPLLKGVDLARVPPRRARAVLGGDPLAAAAPGPALAAGPGWVALGFDPDRTFLAASPAYPLFLRNCVEHLAGGGAPKEPEFFAVGEAAPVAGVALVSDVHGAAGEEVRVGERLVGPPGFWRIGERTLAVNLLHADLDLRPADQPSDPLPDAGEPGRPERPLAHLFAAAALALLLVAWWAFWR